MAFLDVCLHPQDQAKILAASRAVSAGRSIAIGQLQQAQAALAAEHPSGGTSFLDCA